MLWADLQEAFYIVMGPFVAYLLLPTFVGSGFVLASLMIVSNRWKVRDPQPVTWERDE